MKFIMAEEGKIYTPAGHDASVMSRSIYKGEVDIHVTSFPAGAGMEEELHEDLSHVFLMLKGSMEVLQKGELIKRLKANDAVYRLYFWQLLFPTDKQRKQHRSSRRKLRA